MPLSLLGIGSSFGCSAAMTGCPGITWDSVVEGKLSLIIDWLWTMTKRLLDGSNASFSIPGGVCAVAATCLLVLSLVSLSVSASAKVSLLQGERGVPIASLGR